MINYSKIFLTILVLLSGIVGYVCFDKQMWGYFFLSLACAVALLTLLITIGAKSKKL